MDFDLRNRLDNTSLRLHQRGLALSHPEEDHDTALLMSAMAIALEALRVLADDVASVQARLDR